MISLIFSVGLTILVVGLAVRWALREDRRRKLAAAHDTKEGVNA
jgi:hypothetical protein